MRVIRCINNNVAICIDGNNRELVAFGKGIGFKKPPYEVPLKAIERTFYDIDNTLVGMIQGIDERVINVSAKIADYARSIIDKPLSSNIVFALADHIDFAISRNKGAKTITMPIIYDVQYLYEKEYKIGEYAISLIRDELKEYLPKEEAGYIALHFINA
ncbi:MAG: PRD domain-containing protein, partial [Erysipelotrichaceae bacterium]|nr:PRD domain-containing protein [Erysipelotrichaceae bacterium]